MSYHGLGIWGWSDVKEAASSTFNRVAAGAGGGALIGGPIGAGAGAVIGLVSGGLVPSGGDSGPPAPAVVSCGTGPGMSPEKCCPPDFTTKFVSLKPDGHTDVVCGNGDILKVKGAEVLSRVSRSDFEGMAANLVAEKKAAAARYEAAKLAASQGMAKSKAEAALQSRPAASGGHGLMFLGLAVAAGVGIYLYKRSHLWAGSTNRGRPLRRPTPGEPRSPALAPWPPMATSP